MSKRDTSLDQWQSAQTKPPRWQVGAAQFVFFQHFRLAAGTTQGILDMSFLIPISTNSNVSLRSEHQKRPKPEIAAKLGDIRQAFVDARELASMDSVAVVVRP